MLLRARAFGFVLAVLLTSTAQARSEFEEIAVTMDDGVVVHGHLAVPDGATGPHAVALLLAGSGPSNRYGAIPGPITATGEPSLLYKDVQDALLRRGIAVFTYDKRGVTPGTADDGSPDYTQRTIDRAVFSTATGARLARDAVTIFDVLAARPDVDPARIGVVGHSEGTALALKLAEQRPSVAGLYMLGLFTRPMDSILEYQIVTKFDRVFDLVDADLDGFITEAEFQPFSTEVAWGFGAWKDFVKAVERTGDDRVAFSEWRHYLEDTYRKFMAAVRDQGGEWNEVMPQAWFLGYFAEGSYLERHAAQCAMTHIFQGQVDVQTPFQDALQLSDACTARGVPLRSFHDYVNLGHGFSPRVGLRQWRDTIGPFDPQVLRDVAEEAAQDLLGVSGFRASNEALVP